MHRATLVPLTPHPKTIILACSQKSGSTVAPEEATKAWLEYWLVKLAALDSFSWFLKCNYYYGGQFIVLLLSTTAFRNSFLSRAFY